MKNLSCVCEYCCWCRFWKTWIAVVWMLCLLFSWFCDLLCNNKYRHWTSLDAVLDSWNCTGPWQLGTYVVLPHLHLWVWISRNRELACSLDFAVGIACRRLLRVPSPTVVVNMNFTSFQQCLVIAGNLGVEVVIVVVATDHLKTREVLGPEQRQLPSR